MANTKTINTLTQKTTLATTDKIPITDSSGKAYYMDVSDLKNALVPALATSSSATEQMAIKAIGYTGAGSAGQFETNMGTLKTLIKNACAKMGVYAIQIRGADAMFDSSNWNNDSYTNPGGAFYTGIVCNQYGIGPYFSILWLGHVGSLRRTTYINGTWTNYSLTQTQL